MSKQRVGILLVEDEDAHAEIVRRSFESGWDRFHLTVATSLQEAKDYVAKLTPDLVITDLVLPDGRGIELLSSEKESFSFPVVVITSHGDEQVAVEAMKAGALDYVVKSETTFQDMPHIAERALREWGHITERKRAQEALRQSNEILKHILSASPIGIGLVEDRTIRWANEAALKIFGFEHEQDYVGRSTRIVYPSEEEYERVGQIIYDKLKAGKPVGVDATFKRQDGTTFVGHLMMSCPDPSDPMKTAIFTISDISWRKHAEQERIQREKLQGVLEMAGAVCHELNQPLQVVSVCSERLLNAISEDSPLYNQAQKIAEKFDMIVEITRKLQSMTKYETKHYMEGTKIIDIDEASRIT